MKNHLRSYHEIEDEQSFIKELIDNYEIEDEH
jgi:hypothetical protein